MSATHFMDVPGFAPTVYVEPDRSLTDGHLLLLAPGRRDGMWEGSQIPNLAKTTAQSIVGAPVDSVSVFNSFASTASGQVERTSKNRPHFMVSKTSNTSSGSSGLGSGAGLQMLAALRNYIAANPTHKFYLSMGFRLTRPFTGTTPSVYPLASIKSPSNLASTKVSVGIQSTNALAGVPGSTSAQRLGFTAATHPADSAEKFVAITTDGFTLATDLSTILLYLGAWDSATQNRAPSVALSRLALVDLNVGSGLTHGTVVSRDQAEWTAALAVGGYYNGDTMSDPAVLVP